ncbi:TniQ family protein [Hymenobacter arcticus]
MLPPDALLERRILPCTFHPGEEELLSSWLVRLAQAHRIKVESLCRHLWPQIILWKRDMDKVAPTIVLETLAARTLTTPHRILQTTLAPVSERLTGMPLLTGQGHSCWLMPLRIHHRTHQGHGLVYCPRCLQQDGVAPYYRRNWRLAFYVACPTCGIYLQEGCPACGAPIIFFRLDIGRKGTAADKPLSTCYQCAFDLSQAPTRPVSSHNLRHYQTLYRISREGWSPAVPYPHQYFQVLRQLVRVLSCPFGRARVLQVDMRLRLSQPVEWLTGGGAFEQLPITERIYLLEQAMWLLTNWPDQFINVMNYHQIRSLVLLRDMAGEVPFWFSSVVTEHFYVTRTNRRLMPPSPPRAGQGHNPLIAPI